MYVQIQRPEKKWKEVIDSPSGSETKHFSHKEEFDQFYDTKASTKPKHTIDSDKTLDEVEQEEEMISIKKEENEDIEGCSWTFRRATHSIPKPDGENA